MDSNQTDGKAPAKDAKAEEMVSVKLVLPHVHDGKEYKAGETVSLPKSDAEYVRKAQGIK